MRTYILALTKYIIAALMIVYIFVAFLQLRAGTRQSRKLLNAALIVLFFSIQILSFGTIFAGLRDTKYLFFGLIQTLVFGAYLVLQRTFYPEGNFTLKIHVCLLMTVGLVILTRLDYGRASKQFFIAILGMVLSLVIPWIMRRINNFKQFTYLYAIVGAAALLVVLVLGQVTQGSKLSYSFFGITIQPSEFVKILFVFFVAGCYYYKATMKEVAIAGAVAAFHVLILVASKDLGSALIFYIVYVFMTLIATGQWRWLVIGAGAGSAAAVFCYHFFSHVRVRVQAFLDPWSYIDTMGYQITQSLFAISGGGLLGRGLTKGTPGTIPYVESDFIFAAIAEEMGVIFAICLIVLCMIVFFSILWVSLNFTDRFYRFAAVGFAVSYIFQTFLTVGGDTKFIPLTGVTLPLVSYGGSSILSTIIMFSIVDAIFIMHRDRMRYFRRRYNREMRQRRYFEERNYRRRRRAYEETAFDETVSGMADEFEDTLIMNSPVELADDEEFMNGN